MSRLRVKIVPQVEGIFIVMPLASSNKNINSKLFDKQFGTVKYSKKGHSGYIKADIQSEKSFHYLEKCRS
jgi:hypothetical protein